MAKVYPLILAMDTATACSTVALTRGTLVDGEILGCLSFSSTLTHSRRLVSLVDLILRQTETDWQMLGGIAVGLGPGSFTGLRIGLATAKGLAAASQKKLLGVATLDSLACQCTTEKKICAVMDARKKQVYAAFYRRPAFGLVEREGDIRTITPDQLAAEIREPVMMVGDGVLAYHDFWRKGLGTLVEFGPFHLHPPSAAAIGLIAGQLLEDNVILDIAAATPLYIRASDAELCLVQNKGAILG